MFYHFCNIMDIIYFQIFLLLKRKPLFLHPMKFFFLILGTFMLYLSCIPCGDSKDYNVRTTTSISSSTDDQKQTHSMESCTPFCTCSCCAAPIFVSASSKVLNEKVVFQIVKYPNYKMPFNAEVHYSIWQPPQIS